MLAKAKTGTGKTLSFLLPAIEGVARTPRAQRRGVSVLIISPTRELAQQIADEANQVLVSGWVGGCAVVLVLGAGEGVSVCGGCACVCVFGTAKRKQCGRVPWVIWD